MGKFLLELALFAGILCQIYLLATRNNEPEVTRQTAVASLESIHQEAFRTMEKQQTAPLSPYAAAPKVTNPHVLQDMAMKEAQRIIQTGDIESFQKQLDDNRVWLRLMGYNY